jgi:fructuronate reductase
MVDRIVPAATAADRDVASGLIGARDEATVVCEPFCQWVIEDAFRGARPAWEAAGALLVPDTRPYEAMKLRLVNGGHSALAYLGLLRGLDTVADAIADPELGPFLERLFESELAPTLEAVPGVDLGDYRAALLTRFANPRMRHKLEQIASDGARKLPLRLLAPARELLAAGREPAGICLAVAAWLRWLAGEDGQAQASADSLHGEVAAAVAGATSPTAAAERALEVGAVFGEDLRESVVFRDLLADGLAELA